MQLELAICSELVQILYVEEIYQSCPILAGN